MSLKDRSFNVRAFREVPEERNQPRQGVGSGHGATTICRGARQRMGTQERGMGGDAKGNGI